MYGLQENTEENLEANLADIFMQLREKPYISHCERLGKSKSARPVKVTLSNSDAVRSVLMRSHFLRKSSKYMHVYLNPDRSTEERKAHKELVDTLRIKIKEESEYYHTIRDGKILSKPKVNPASKHSNNGQSSSPHVECE